ncbi:MAG: universal stress protein [Gallionellaceae bacterium]
MGSRILTAMDGSDSSRHAMKQAIELARNWSAKLRIVHVADMNWLPIGPELAIDTLWECWSCLKFSVLSTPNI